MFLTINDAKLFTIAFGSPARPAILGIGGWIGSWELWAEPFSYLSADYHTITYDHRGSGATIAPVASITFEQLVDDLFAVLDAYHIERSFLAAESAGVAIALGAALRRPQRIAGLILVDGFYYGNAPGASDPFLAGLHANYPATLDAFVEACVPEADREHIKRWGRQVLGRAAPEAAIALYRVTGALDLRPQLGRITQPALVLHGEADNLVPLDAARALAQALPQARLAIVHGAGHVPTMTRPLEVTDEIRRFLGSVGY